MNRLPDDEIVALLRAAMPIEPHLPRTDLWPRVRKRIDRPAPTAAVADWVIIVALAVVCLLQPALVGILLLHL